MREVIGWAVGGDDQSGLPTRRIKQFQHTLDRI
jgi:hypothetical protein